MEMSKDFNKGELPFFARRAMPIIALFLFLLPGLATGQDRPPNFVFIIADDLGWADVAFHGGPTPTPNLDRLLDEGVELTQHYVAPVCSPTRAGFLTGRYWSRFGVTTPVNTQGLPFGTVTLARVLGDSGYTTALIGKWHLGSKPEWGPNHFGFHYSYGSLAGGVTPYSHQYKKGIYSTTWHRNHELIEQEGHVTDVLTDEAVEWIHDHKEKPFFLYLPYTAVHIPIREPEEWLANVPDSIEGEVPRQYSACIMHLDAAVGRVVTAIDEAGLIDNTLIVFTSDNGGTTAQNNDRKYPDDHCPNGRVPGDNKPFRGQKGTLYEGGVRVPTIARWPGKLKPRTQLEQIACIVDWMPTFYVLAKSKTDSGALRWDGVNLWPALVGEATLPERLIYLAGVRHQRWAIRDGEWKLILNKSGPDELYHISKDASESNNIAGLRPDILKSLKVKLDAQRKQDVPTRGGL